MQKKETNTSNTQAIASKYKQTQVNASKCKQCKKMLANRSKYKQI